MVGVKAFGQELVHKFLKSKAALLYSDYVRNGIVYFTGDGRIYCANLTSKGLMLSVEIENADYYTGQAFECLKLADVIGVNKIPQGCYVCDKGKVTPLNIAKRKVIDRTVQIDNMKDFVEENFDKSETEGHNQYCTQAEEVVYNFTLVPPIFNTEKFSDIYQGAEAVLYKWQNNFKSINLTEIINALSDLGLNESGLSLTCKEIIGFDKRISGTVSQHDYKKYYNVVKNFSDWINYSAVEDYCRELFTKVNAENADTKLVALDKEIAGYRQTIEEKQAEIAKGVVVVGISSNIDRIKDLEDQIAELTNIKQRILAGAAARNNKQQEAFMALCRQVTDGIYAEEVREVDSLGNVLSSKEVAKIVKLESFVKTYLRQYNAFNESAKGIVTEFEAVDIPTDYVVYEQGGTRVIAIENEQEYYDTEKIRKRYNLQCFARRGL